MLDLEETQPYVVTPERQQHVPKPVKKIASAKSAAKVRKSVNIKKATTAIAKLQSAKRKIEEVAADNNLISSGIKQECIQRCPIMCREFQKTLQTPPTGSISKGIKE